MVMTTDSWSGTELCTTVLESPDWSDIQAAISQLDQRAFTNVGLQQGDGTVLLIGGGSGRYTVSMMWPDDRSVSLCDPLRRQEPVELVTGGVVGLVDGDLIVDEQRAVRAARTFIETGAPDHELDWRAT